MRRCAPQSCGAAVLPRTWPGAVALAAECSGHVEEGLAGQHVAHVLRQERAHLRAAGQGWQMWPRWPRWQRWQRWQRRSPVREPPSA
jgi:hypothetical protein